MTVEDQLASLIEVLGTSAAVDAVDHLAAVKTALAGIAAMPPSLDTTAALHRFALALHDIQLAVSADRNRHLVAIKPDNSLGTLAARTGIDRTYVVKLLRRQANQKAGG